MRYKLLYHSVYLLLIIFVAKVVCDYCPKPSVKKRTIIQSTESIKNGARLISKDIVGSARNCYRLCCDDLSCNVAVMHYKQRSNDLGVLITEKYCFLFACGLPSKCTYEFHRRYAVIDLGRRQDRSDVGKEEKTVTLPPLITSPPTSPSTTTTTIGTSPVKEISTTITPAKSLSSVPSSVKVPISVKVPTSITKESKWILFITVYLFVYHIQSNHHYH